MSYFPTVSFTVPPSCFFSFQTISARSLQAPSQIPIVLSQFSLSPSTFSLPLVHFVYLFPFISILFISFPTFSFFCFSSFSAFSLPLSDLFFAAFSPSLSPICHTMQLCRIRMSLIVKCRRIVLSLARSLSIVLSFAHFMLEQRIVQHISGQLVPIVAV